MTTIGYATLQIIPSLKGVTEAIEKQLKEAGKASGKGYSEEFNKQVEKDAKPDEAITKGTKTAEAGKAAGKEYSEEFNKEVTKDVKVDEAIAESTKTTGGGGIGQAAQEAAGEFGKGFREGVADALSQTTLDDTLIRWGGRFGQVLKPAVETGLQQVSAGVAAWSAGLATDIASGDIRGAADSITGVIQNTTNTIRTIGDTFGIETGKIESFSQGAVSEINRIGGSIQGIIDKGGQVGGTFQGAGDAVRGLSGTVEDLGGKDFAGPDTKFGKSISRIEVIGDVYDITKLLNDELSKLASGSGININRNPYQDLWDVVRGRGLNDQQLPPAGYSGSGTFQTGGMVRGPGGTDNVLAWLTAGEGVIKKSAMANGGAEIMAALNAGWTPSADWLHALIPGFDSGGTVSGVDTVRQIAAQFGLSLTSGFRSGDPGHHGSGEAGDFGGSADAMRAFADYMYSNYGSKLAELIHESPGFTGNVKDGRNVGAFGEFYTLGQAGFHGDHVHIAVRGGTKITAPGVGDLDGGGGGEPTVPLTQTAAGTWTSPNAAWATLIARESGGQNIRQRISDANSGGNEAEGIFQITPSTWKSYGGTDFAPNPLAATPEEQAIVAARILHGNPSGGDWGSGLAGRENAADLLAGLGTTRPSRSSSVDTAAPTSPSIERVASPPVTAAPTASSSVSVPASISGLSGFGLDKLNVKTKVSPDSPERTFEIGNVAGAAVSGQVASALGVFGVPDSPGWLQGISKFVGGISIGGPSNAGSAAPLAASSSTLGSQLRGTDMHGSRAGQPPGPGVVYNIAARDTEDAFIRAQRQERERAAAKLSRF